MPPHRFVIFNAQGMGVDSQTDAAIVDSFEDGVVSTAALVYDGPSALSAVRMARAARRHPDSLFAGLVLSDGEKSALHRLGSFAPPAPPHSVCAMAVEEKEETDARPSHQSLPLGLMLRLDSALRSSDATDASALVPSRQLRCARQRKAPAFAATARPPPTGSAASSAQLEVALKRQLDWFISLTSYPPLFVLAEQQRHTSSPLSELLARLLPRYGVRCVSAMKPASPDAPAWSQRRCSLAESRTAMFVFAERGLLVGDAEWEWRLRDDAGDAFQRSLAACVRGCTDIALHFDDTSDAHGWKATQQRLLDVCNAGQVQIINHQQLAALAAHSTPIPASALASHSLSPLRPSAWHELPNDVIRHVYAFLSPASFLLSRRVCREWQRQALKPHATWGRLLWHVHPHLPASSLLRMSRSALPIRRVRVSTKNVAPDSINSLHFLAQLPQLTDVELAACTGVAVAVQGEWLKALTGLQRLSIASCDITDDCVHALAPLIGLVSLQLSHSLLSVEGVARLCALLFPRLTSLDLSFRHSEPWSTQLDRRYAEEVDVLRTLLDATQRLDQSHDLASTSCSASYCSCVSLPALRTVDVRFGGYQQHGERWGDFVDAVHRFKRERPHILLRSALDPIE